MDVLKSVEVEFGVVGKVEEGSFPRVEFGYYNDLSSIKIIEDPEDFASIQEHIHLKFYIDWGREATIHANRWTSSWCFDEISSQQEVSLF